MTSMDFLTWFLFILFNNNIFYLYYPNFELACVTVCPMQAIKVDEANLYIHKKTAERDIYLDKI